MSDAQELLRKDLHRVFLLGQTYWQQADSQSQAENNRSDVTYAKFAALVEEVLARQPAAQSEGAVLQDAEQSTDKDARIAELESELCKAERLFLTYEQYWLDEKKRADSLQHKWDTRIVDGSPEDVIRSHFRRAEAAEQRVAALEAQIKAAQEGEPVAWYGCHMKTGKIELMVEKPVPSVIRDFSM